MEHIIFEVFLLIDNMNNFQLKPKKVQQVNDLKETSKKQINSPTEYIKSTYCIEIILFISVIIQVMVILDYLLYLYRNIAYLFEIG